MIIISRINGVDCKIGRNSRTGSTISMIVPDENIIDVVSYFNDFKGGNDPIGKVKKIELVIYEDGDELETIESLRATNQDLRDFIDNLDTVVKSSEALIDSIVIEEDENQICPRCKSDDIGINDYDEKVCGNCDFVIPVEEKKHLPANQGDLPLYKEVPKQEVAKVGRIYDENGDIIPMSQRL